MRRPSVLVADSAGREGVGQRERVAGRPRRPGVGRIAAAGVAEPGPRAVRGVHQRERAVAVRVLAQCGPGRLRVVPVECQIDIVYL